MLSDVRAVVEVCRNPDYWRGLVPGLQHAASHPLPRFAIAPPTASALRADVNHDGYFRLPGVFPARMCADLVTAIDVLRRLQIPPVFVFVYDEVWRLAEHLLGVAEIFLGPGARMLPGIWAWWVEPHANDGGWPPHRDRPHNALRADGSPNSISMWVPLTEATPDNGCMYVIPGSVDTDYAQRRLTIMRPEARFARAIPAPAGAVLGWNQAVLHWGGRSSAHAAGPRVSLGFEFQRSDAPAVDLPLVDSPAALSHDHRLALIGKAVYSYFGRVKLSPGYYELAVHLAQLLWRSDVSK